ncbi:MAG: L,D-transpeptidase [Actinomycetota bacterium]
MIETGVRRWSVAPSTLIVGAFLIVVAAVGTIALEPPAPAAPGIATPSTGALRTRSLPQPVQPAFIVPRPVPLSSSRSVSHWAPVALAITARTHPDVQAPVIAELSTSTPEGTQNIAQVLTTAKGRDGRLWARVRLPVLPNNTVGWVPRTALGGLGVVRTRLIVDLDARTATLYRSGEAIFNAPVGVGRAAWPTPRGRFYIRNKLTSFSSAAYGPLAFGTSARSDVLTDWPAGGFIGIHGTDQPELLPGAVSHGCIRMSNDDILELGRLMPVGTPLTIR